MTRARDIADVGYKDELVDDTTPQLGGALDAQSNIITSVGALGVGTAAPAVNAHVQTTSGNPQIRVESTGANYVTYSLKNSVRQYSAQIRTDQSNAFVIRDETGGGNRLLIDASGRVTTPNQPSFTAHLTSNQAVTAYVDNTITGFTCPSHGNVGSHFNTSNGRFTAPVTGFYLFTGAIQTNTLSSLHIAFHMNGSAYESDSWIDHGSSTGGAELTRIMYLTANQYVTLVMLPTINQNVNANRTRFQGYLLG